VQSLVLYFRFLVLLLAISGTVAPASAQPPGGPPGRGEIRNYDVDPEKDFNLVRLKSHLDLTTEQWESLVSRYRRLRADQTAVLQTVLRESQIDRQGPPSPERRALQETRLRKKTDPVNQQFLADVRQNLTESQKSEFDEMVTELDLYPIRGAAQAEAINRPFDLKNRITIEERDGFRIITANGIPDYLPGIFPGRGNPAAISEQNYVFRMTLSPKINDYATPHRRILAGVALNGVVFDPGTAEMWRNDPRSGWRQEAISPLTISGARMGLDASNAHVQPNGAYHYHSLPIGLIKRIAQDRKLLPGKQMIHIGWSPDGFPIYDSFGYSLPADSTSPLREMRSSYRLKTGNRPDENAVPPGPGNSHDGTYTQDFQYVAGSGDLDECNGRVGVTPEFPDGTYYYVITSEYPFIPRLFRGTPDPSFLKNDQPQGRGGRPPTGRPR